MISTASFARPWVNFSITNKTKHPIFVHFAGQKCIHDGKKYIQVQGNPKYATYQKMHHDKIKVGSGDAFQIEYDMDNEGGSHFILNPIGCKGKSKLLISLFNTNGDKVMHDVTLKFVRNSHADYTTKIMNSSQNAYSITPTQGGHTGYVGTLKSL